MLLQKLALYRIPKISYGCFGNNVLVIPPIKYVETQENV